MKPLRRLDAHDAVVIATAWNPYGTLLAVAASNQSVTLWDTVNWTQSRTISQPAHHIRGIAWSPDGKELAINTTESLLVWDVNR